MTSGIDVTWGDDGELLGYDLRPGLRLGIDDFNEVPDLGPAPRLSLRALRDVQARQVRWLLPGLIPLRTLTLVAGVGGLGKSTLLAGVAAKVSRGELLDGPSDVILISYEDA